MKTVGWILLVFAITQLVLPGFISSRTCTDLPPYYDGPPVPCPPFTLSPVFPAFLGYQHYSFLSGSSEGWTSYRPTIYTIFLPYLAFSVLIVLMRKWANRKGFFNTGLSRLILYILFGFFLGTVFYILLR